MSNFKSRRLGVLVIMNVPPEVYHDLETVCYRTGSLFGMTPAALSYLLDNGVRPAIKEMTLPYLEYAQKQVQQDDWFIAFTRKENQL